MHYGVSGCWCKTGAYAVGRAVSEGTNQVWDENKLESLQRA